MTDIAQGGGVALRPNADGDNNPANDPKAGIGYNVPSLLGVARRRALHARRQRAHAGGDVQEPVLDAPSGARSQLLAGERPQGGGAEVDALVQYLLSIDEDTRHPAASPGPQGGALCPDSFAPPPVP